VKKAVNWALRQIGKRNAELREAAIEVAESLARGGVAFRALDWP
jgi:3-methyladenine DNA glycosylase AlkD